MAISPRGFWSTSPRYILHPCGLPRQVRTTGYISRILAYGAYAQCPDARRARPERAASTETCQHRQRHTTLHFETEYFKERAKHARADWLCALLFHLLSGNLMRVGRQHHSHTHVHRFRSNSHTPTTTHSGALRRSHSTTLPDPTPTPPTA